MSKKNFKIFSETKIKIKRGKIVFIIFIKSPIHKCGKSKGFSKYKHDGLYFKLYIFINKINIFYKRYF